MTLECVFLYTNIQKFLKEVYYAYQVCIYLWLKKNINIVKYSYSLK